MRALIQEVDVLNEEEEEAAKLKQEEKYQHDNKAEQVEKTEHIGTGAIKKRNNSSTSCFKHKRKKERGRHKPEKGGMQGEK